MTRILYDLLYMVPVTLLITSWGKSLIGGPGDGIIASLCALGVLAIGVILRHAKTRLRFLLPGAAVVIFVAVLLIRSPEEWGTFLWDSRWLGLTVAAAVLGFFFGWLLTLSRLVRRITGLAVLAVLILIMIFIPETGKTGVCPGIFLLLLYVADEIQYRWNKSGYPEARGHLVSIAPFLLVLGLLVYLIPAPEKPYDWEFAVNLWEKVTDVVKWAGGLFGSEEDYDSVVGFSDDGTFSGTLSEKEGTVMTMTLKNDPGPAVYLRGKVMDSFDGREWTGRYTEENRDEILDVLETICAVNRYDADYFSDYMRRVELKLTYEDFSTEYLFVPSKANLRWDRIDEEEYSKKGGDLIAEDTRGYGTSYAIPYYRLNRDHEAFREFLQSVGDPDEKSWQTTQIRYESKDVTGGRTDNRQAFADTSYQAYQKYRERIRKYYLPETKLSKQTEDYIRQITDGAKTTYDKLQCLEQALSGFNYTTNPGPLPAEVTSPESFMDEFLLKKREGYCAYFATAFVLMARSQGIPARYVQGFRVRTSGTDPVSIQSGMSHAWPEAYIDGVGWLTFEPTPGMYSRSSWGIKKNKSGASDSAQTESAPVPTQAPAPAVPEPVLTEEETGHFHISYVLVPVGLLLIFLIVFLLAERILASARFRRQSVEERFATISRMNLRILAFLGFEFQPGETIEEFYHRAGEKLTVDALAFLRSSELVAYAGRQADATMLAEAMKNREILMEELKNARGKWYYRYRVLFDKSGFRCYTNDTLF